ncbi:MAG: 1-acyl-sn-glycerol-3-phosphate acyltransferase [Candidatus Lumbricidophila eiseniae]|uniref:1-acyl-sn-glycerol-3-phosphate acyltransferase n=1 Tax=Candidatus Lumbricidiphila eiseniae TaxID=1969409 RepID=A0A2A6FU80_9MICO|nr:MAG: 1-acyl-sn-glycerol-3-phosphate acyltransferase [Candidatus Lumbricidophila eiseniae]
MSSETRRPSFFWIGAGLAVPFMKLTVTYRFHHPERLPQTGAYIIAPNHHSEIDPVVVGVACWKLGRAPRFLAKASLFKIPVVGWLLRRLGQIPVERSGKNGHAALRAAEQLVAREQIVIVYPEGSLTRDPELWPMRGKTGAARIALERGIPIIPLAHWGTQHLMPRYGKMSLFPRKRIDVSFGEPMDLTHYAGRALDQATLTELTDEIMVQITALLAELRGESAPAQRWDPAVHGQQETGRLEE